MISLFQKFYGFLINEIYPKILDSLKCNSRLIIQVLLTIGVFFTFLFVFSFKKGISPTDLTRDPSDILSYPPYIGFISYLGVFLWCGIATIGWLGFAILKKFTALQEKSKFYFYNAILISILVVDDTFQGHEYFIRHVIKLPELTMYIFYSSFLFFILIKYFNFIVEPFIGFFFMAFSCFGCSVFIDIYLDWIAYSIFVEDTFKFLGICFWFIFFMKHFVHDIERIGDRSKIR